MITNLEDMALALKVLGIDQRSLIKLASKHVDGKAIDHILIPAPTLWVGAIPVHCSQEVTEPTVVYRSDE